MQSPSDPFLPPGQPQAPAAAPLGVPQGVPNATPMETQPQTYGMLCCMCGNLMEPNPSGTCVSCLKSQVDITAGIDTQQTIQFCRQCGGYNVGNDKYVIAELESPQLLGICLKKIRGLRNVRLVNASFIWTEPHSKRIKVKLVVQKEVAPGAVLQQEHVCTFFVSTTMCLACRYTYTEHTWRTCVQVRQKVAHKRTFLYLEQILIRCRGKLNIINVQEQPNGLDFFFGTKSDANRFVDLLHTTVPGRHSCNETVVSEDLKNNTANVKYTIPFEIVPLCRDDLVCLPKAMASSLGGLGPLCIVEKVNSKVHFVDPITGRRGVIAPHQYFAAPFPAIQTRANKVEVYVIDVQPVEGNSLVVDVECQREQDMFEGTTSYSRSHMVKQLASGRSAAAYDLSCVDLQTYGVPEALRIPTSLIICGRWKAPGSSAKSRPVPRLETEEGIAIVTANDEDIQEVLGEMDDDAGMATELEMLVQGLESMATPGQVAGMVAGMVPGLEPLPGAPDGAPVMPAMPASASAPASAPGPAPAQGLTYMQYGGMPSMTHQGFCPQ